MVITLWFWDLSIMVIGHYTINNLDKPCNICFLLWVGKMINIDLCRRKSFGWLTRVVHKSSWAKLKPRRATPQKERNIGRNTTSSSRMKYIFYSLNTMHEWFRFKKRFKVRWQLLDIQQDAFLDWLFPALYRSSRYCFPSVCSPNVLKKKTSHNWDDSLPINCLSSANQQCVQPVSVAVFFFNSKLSLNPSWVKWCIFKTSQRSHSLERAQEVKQWSLEG